MNKEVKNIKTVTCPDCGKQIAVSVPVSGNGSEIMTKESIEEVFGGMADCLLAKIVITKALPSTSVLMVTWFTFGIRWCAIVTW